MALFRGLYIRWHTASAGVAQKCLAKNAPVAQLDRASDYESEGRTFESFRARQISPSRRKPRTFPIPRSLAGLALLRQVSFPFPDQG